MTAARPPAFPVILAGEETLGVARETASSRDLRWKNNMTSSCFFRSSVVLPWRWRSEVRMAQCSPRRPVRRWLSAGLACLLASSGLMQGMAAQAPAAPQLRIVILEGEGAINNIRQRTAREPIVEVQDENSRPVAGAVVTFTLPDRGASGTFANGQTSMTITTDAQGRAVGTGLHPNNVEGSFQIRVSASHQGRTAAAIISQTNAVAGAAAAGGGSGKVIAILLVAAGAAAGGVVAATRGGNKGGPTTPPPGSSPTTFTAGTPTISGPR